MVPPLAQFWGSLVWPTLLPGVDVAVAVAGVSKATSPARKHPQKEEEECKIPANWELRVQKVLHLLWV